MFCTWRPQWFYTGRSCRKGNYKLSPVLQYFQTSYGACKPWLVHTLPNNGLEARPRQTTTLLNMVKASFKHGLQNKPHSVQTEQHVGATLQNPFHWQAQNEAAWLQMCSSYWETTKEKQWHWKCEMKRSNSVPKKTRSIKRVKRVFVVFLLKPALCFTKGQNVIPPNHLVRPPNVSLLSGILC